MTPQQMINQLHTHGGDAASDYNDGELQGWFGWSINDDDVLTVNYEPSNEDGDPGELETASWRLVPVDQP